MSTTTPALQYDPHRAPMDLLRAVVLHRYRHGSHAEMIRLDVAGVVHTVAADELEAALAAQARAEADFFNANSTRYSTECLYEQPRLDENFRVWMFGQQNCPQHQEVVLR